MSENIFNNFSKQDVKLHYLLKKTDLELLYSLANPFSKKDEFFLQKINKMKKKTQEQTRNSVNLFESTNSLIKPKRRKSNFGQLLNSDQKSKLNTKRNSEVKTKLDDVAYKRVSQSLPKNVKVSDLNILSKLYKMDKRYNKIINGELDKEIIVIDKNKKLNRLPKNDKNITTDINCDSKKVYRLIKVDNQIFNNCTIKNKTIYDIKPLNKLNEKGRCIFQTFFEKKNPKSETEPNILLNDFNIKNDNKILVKNFTTYYTHKTESTEAHTEFKKSKSSTYNKKKEIKKLNRVINLKSLYKQLPKSQQVNNLRIFYLKDGSGASRGAKIKFLKTTYPVEMIKPLSTQKSIKIIKGSKTEKKFDSVIKKYDVNHYALDIEKRKNMIEINKMNHMQKNIINNIKNEFHILNKKLFDRNCFDPEELPEFPDNKKVINENLGKI